MYSPNFTSTAGSGTGIQNDWRKRVGVEPTRDVSRPSPVLKTGRPTGERFSSVNEFRKLIILEIAEKPQLVPNWHQFRPSRGRFLLDAKEFEVWLIPGLINNILPSALGRVVPNYKSEDLRASYYGAIRNNIALTVF